MSEQEQIQKSHAMATEWFCDHKARLLPMVSYEHAKIIEWKRLDTYNYSMIYTIMGGYVIVVGDVGDAIYGFGSVLTLEKLASFDWHYFVSKCLASETGRNYTMKIPGIGHPVPNVRAIGHYVGLQMAIKQLGATPATASP